MKKESNCSPYPGMLLQKVLRCLSNYQSSYSGYIRAREIIVVGFNRPTERVGKRHLSIRFLFILPGKSASRRNQITPSVDWKSLNVSTGAGRENND